MSLPLLFKDELKGFYKSHVMLFLWVGLPLISLLMNIWSPDTGGEIPLTLLIVLLISSLGGTLAAVMLAVSIINEKNRRVYDLFLIRPIRRRDVLLSKFFAVYLCVIIASMMALAVGLGIDHYSSNVDISLLIEKAIESMTISFAMMAIACSAGILIGVISPSVLVGAILVIYGGNQISALSVLPSVLEVSNALVFTVILGVVVSIAFLALSVFLFEKKQF
ncbi:MAG: ABC transporter permease subunit [Candidatus Thermoplasmatota archaeon]|nr:ABC transporter permease subunit [Candidatus Thermoplasmatota archaeon]